LLSLACDTDSADNCSDDEEPFACKIQSNIAEQLRDWSMKCDISLVAVAALLSLLGGSTVGDITCRMLREMFTNQISLTLNFAGRVDVVTKLELEA